MGLRPHLVVSAPSTGVSNVCEAKNVLLLVQNEECVCEMHSFDRGPLPPLCLPRYRHNTIHVKKGPGLPSAFLHTASDQKLGGGKAWEQG